MNKQLDIKKQLTDQSAHLITAFVVIAPLLTWPGIASAVFAGLMIGLVREITEAGTKVTIATVKSALTPWSLVDISFWGLGGLLAGIILT
jgi:type III secretory pathway component EscS